MQRTITVKGVGSFTAKVDYVTISLPIETLRKEYEHALLVSAAQNARAKAEVLCRAAGCGLGELLNIDYNWGELNIYSSTRYEMEQSLMVREASCAPEIEPDDVYVSDSVAFTWALA